MITSKLTLLILPLLFFACKKDPPIDPEPTEPVMPPLTHQGLNTFGCYIDGELFVANEGWTVWDLPSVSGSYNEVEKQLNMQGSRHINEETDEADNIKISADIPDGLGEYNYLYHEDGSNGYRNWNGGHCSYEYRSVAGLDVGKLYITYLNEEENIIAGTFYINLYNPDCETDTIMKITDGRFDFRY